MHGFNIVLEGPDGAGKSTLLPILQQFVQEKLGREAEVYGHPGATALGRELRKLVKHRNDLVVDRYTEQVLMSADLCAFITEILVPGIERGKIILSDRSNLISGYIYGTAGGVDSFRIKALHDIAMALFPPPMYLIVLTASYDEIIARQHHDIEVADGVEKQVECKFQNRGSLFHEKVCELYQGLGLSTVARFVANEQSFWKVNAARPQSQVAEEVCEILRTIISAS